MQKSNLQSVLAIVAVVSLIALAGCATETASQQEFEEQAVFVNNVTVSADTVNLTLTDQMEYTTETCSWNPATKTTLCNTYYHNTKSTQITVTHDNETVQTFDGNYEGETIEVNSSDTGQYTLVIEMKNTQDTTTIQFNRTSTGNVTAYYENPP